MLSGAIMAKAGKQATQQTLDNFYKRKLVNTNDNSCSTSQNQASKRSKASTNGSGQHQNQLDPHTSETPRQNNEELDLNSLERDPGKRKQIWSYPVNKREQVRRAYLNSRPFQIHLKEYHAKGSTKHPHFTEQERVRLKYELELLNIAMKENLQLSQVSTLAGLCICLVKTGKCESYSMIDRLIRLILTLPVSTATTERVFSAMKICKNRLRNKMADEFLADSLVVYIKKEIAETFSSDYVVDVFKNLKGHKADL
ncbi:hypothetical protein CTI12_AA604070 [Artemisia annua]|uniref:HAT C-terminal dimerisation domain-containing protein n=1 Tax=Artemisia annua TaxID=35608 RepID=A0A2U1KGV8_ARTAN|nr:hypothetical protein CTI12_AA604070 [Artemisia annua]